MIRTFSGMIRTSVPEGCPMMRLTPLSLAANTIFYLILAVMYCRVLTRRFSWPFTLLGLTVGYLLYIIPTKFMPYADAERMLFGSSPSRSHPSSCSVTSGINLSCAPSPDWSPWPARTCCPSRGC